MKVFLGDVVTSEQSQQMKSEPIRAVKVTKEMQPASSAGKRSKDKSKLVLVSLLVDKVYR